MNGEMGSDDDDDEEFDNHMPITQAEPPSSPPIGISQATTVSMVSGSANALGRNADGCADGDGSEENELEVSFKAVDDSSDKLSSFSKSPISSSSNLAALLVSPPISHTFARPAERLPAKENTFGATLWQHLNSNDPHIGESGFRGAGGGRGGGAVKDVGAHDIIFTCPTPPLTSPLTPPFPPPPSL